MMRQRKKTGLIAAIAALACASGAMAAPAPSPASTHQQSAAHHLAYGRGHARLGYAPGQSGVRPGHHVHFADLVGDPYSGLGFYPLPLRYRIGAYRYNLRHARPAWANPVRQAVAADAVRNWNWYRIPTEATSYRYGVFDPNEGVGTPFFAGYYSAGDRDGTSDDDPYFPFGRPIAR